MLLKRGTGRVGHNDRAGFSTLYRVDAIEAGPDRARGRRLHVSVPSIGSMLLKRRGQRQTAQSGGLFQYPLSGRCY